MPAPRGFAVDILGRLIGDLGLDAGACRVVAHGTTIATNAIIERTGARTGLITTQGFRDVLELRRIRIPRLYDLAWSKPAPLVERYLRREIIERMTFRGDIETPLDPASVRSAATELLRRGVEAIAVSLINAYANPAHERVVRDILAALAPNLPVTLSSDVLPEMREYERTSTTVINAYVMPVVQRYLASLERGLRRSGFAAPLLLMQSSGGAMSAEVAAEQPMHIIESGPAAGVVAAQRLARRIGCANAVTLDIGGTTAKASLIEDGEIGFSSEYEVGAGFTRAGLLSRGGGYALRSPTIDISEIGAGGGSVVRLDDGGALQVGPKSAGANPGPVCYRRGGSEPTLTDACLVLGYLDPHGLAGGAVPLDADAAAAALRDRIAAPLGLDVTELADGVFRVAVANMTRAIRSVSTERGKDPRDFDLIAFGGNGGLFAAAVARELELPRIVVPPGAGIFSAFGLLYSDLEHHFTQTLLGRLDRIDPDAAEAHWRRLEATALGVLAREGFAPEACRLRRFGELRYVSQSHELRVPWPAGPTCAASLPRLQEYFEAAHERAYGHRGHDGLVELVTLHLLAQGIPDRPLVPERLCFAAAGSVLVGRRRAYFGGEGGWHSVAVVTRASLSETPRLGPLVIGEFDSTILVPPNFAAARDRWSNVILTRRA